MHGSLKMMDTSILKWLMKFLCEIKYDGVVTLEVFSYDDLEESLNIIKGIDTGREV